MSQRRVGYEGRHPIVVDEGPASVAATSPIAMHQNGGLPHLAVPTGGAGDVEVTRVEVDEETRAAARAARTAIGQPMYVATPTDRERAYASRMRGGQVNRERIAAAKEEPMSQPVDAAADQPPDTFQALSEAAATASEAWARRQAAEIAWEAARTALAKVLAIVDELVGARTPTTAFAGGAKVEAAPRTALDGATRIVERPKPKPRSRVGEGQHSGQASEHDQRAARVMAAMARLGDDQAAVAAELGMKKNAVAMIVKHARRRAA